MIVKALLGLFIVISTGAMYLSLASRSVGWVSYSIPSLKEGDISPKREIAPFDFVVPKPDRVLAEERRREEEKVPPVYRYTEAMADTVSRDVQRLFTAARMVMDGASPDSAAGLYAVRNINAARIDTLATVLSRFRPQYRATMAGLIESAADSIYSYLIVTDRKTMLDDPHHSLTLYLGFEDSTVSVSEIADLTDASKMMMAHLEEGFNERVGAKSRQFLIGLADDLLMPNVVYDSELTRERRQEARLSVPPFFASFKKNERIIDANVQVGAEQVAALETLREELSRRSFLENPREHYLIALGKTLMAYALYGIFLAYLFIHRRKLFSSIPRLSLLTLIAYIPLIVAFYSANGGVISEYLIPVALAGMLASILFDAELAIMISMVVSFLVAQMMPEAGLRLGLMYFLAGGIGAVSVGHVRHRKEFYRSMFFIPVTMALAVVSMNDWLHTPSIADVGNDMFLAAMNGFFCPIIAIGILPLLESVFKVTTDITLLELSDLNNPLLKELAVKAPGTFSSVIVVGTLAEAAAEKIGANPLLSRVGSYYHDIGKMVIPEYFIENQLSEQNPHDRLSPHMSALVIASHVKEGYELGMKYGLPKAILDIIRQHHGTSLIAAIYHKAVEQNGDEPVDESAFRYEGPKPQTREAGIVMLADLVEAASRTVNERSMGRLKTLINTIIQKRFLDGELDECDLTLKDLHDIEESFLPVLIGSHHGRIEYPWQKQVNKAANHDEKSQPSENGKNGRGKSEHIDNR